MLVLTICIDAPAGHTIGVKEAIAQDLEKYGDVRVVRVVRVEDRQGVQMEIGGM